MFPQLRPVYGGKYMQELGQVGVRAAPTAGPETYLEVLEGLLGRQRLAVTHSGGKDIDS